MRREFAFALIAFCPLSSPPANNPPRQLRLRPQPRRPTAQTAYYAGPGVTAPELLPVSVTDLATGHCKKLDGTLTLSVIVDANGTYARSHFTFVPPARARPGSFRDWSRPNASSPARMTAHRPRLVNSIDVNLKACTEKEKTEAGQKLQLLRLHSAPDQKLRLMEPHLRRYAQFWRRIATPARKRNHGSPILGQEYVATRAPLPARVADYSDEGRAHQSSGQLRYRTDCRRSRHPAECAHYQDH